MKLKFLFVPVAFIVLVITALYMERKQLAGKGDFVVDVENSNRHTLTLTWRDAIEAPMALRLEEILFEFRNKADTIILKLDSQGGSLREGGKVVALLKEAKKHHRLKTYVGKYDICLSMCVPIYLQGDVPRRAAKSSRWMFHQPITTNFLTDETIYIPQAEKDKISEAFFQTYFVNSEMDPLWREWLYEEWVGKEVWKTGEELFEEKANIVQEVF